MTVPDRVAAFEAGWTPEPNSGCWLWMGGASGQRYGSFQKLRAHRVAWELYRGPIPPGMCVLHKCDVTFCVNPDHLFLGSQQENMADRTQKNRTARQRGNQNGRAVLTAENIREIRASATSCAAEAEKWGVHHSAIGRVRRMQRWGHIQ